MSTDSIHHRTIDVCDYSHCQGGSRHRRWGFLRPLEGKGKLLFSSRSQTTISGRRGAERPFLRQPQRQSQEAEPGNLTRAAAPNVSDP